MDATFWKDRYVNQTTGWDIGSVSSPLKAYFDQLDHKDMAICIPGCGFGHEANYLHNNGFKNITVLDLVPDALKPLENTAIKGIVGDFFEHEGQYDLVVEQTFYCAIDPIRRDELVTKVHQLLQPNGKWIGVLFNRSFEGGPPFGGSMEEYRKRLSPLFDIKVLEPCYNSIPQRAGSEVFFIATKRS